MIVLYVLGGLGLLKVLVRVEVLRAMDQRAALHEIEVKYLQESLGHVDKRIDDLRRAMDAHDNDLRKYLDHTREVSITPMSESATPRRNYGGFLRLPAAGACDMLRTRPARYSGEKAPLRGISHHQVCVLVARDRQTSTVSEVVGRGRVTAQQIGTALDGVLHDCVLCTDAASAYRTYANDKQIPLEALNARRGVKKRGIYHLGNVNGYHSRLKRWIRPFNGVSTKYLPNYLVWFQRIDSTHNIARNVVASRLLDHSHAPMVFTTTKKLLSS